ncbi:hypothetical protein [Frigoriglobus tundricola]|uniref:Uncharacterized protein n=1 Tax=Frigoriglobus tundricola TaxID=2774151 RepID=A0A6M5YYH9_9BACT|nr:hypothetical protein [Frigoriglobus tundricola]QJW98594.1 hypothetical protein FTUN_6189 [Frigoriglobus tundricola]
MGLTAAQRRTLSRKAADNSLEVEHLLKVAAIGDAADAALLRTLKGEHGWSDSGREGRQLVVPFGRWADTVCRLLEGGYAGLVRMAGEAGGADEFCIGVLEEVRTPESVSALLAIVGPVVERPASDVRLAVRLADGLNHLLSFKGRPAITPAVEQQVREFLHRLLALELTEVQRASAVCALRGVGDAGSLSVVAGVPPFRGSWAGLEQSAAKQIRQRLRRAAKPAEPVAAPDPAT